MGFSVNQRNSLRSPHVLGKDTRRQRDDSVRGITPACAGKSTAMVRAMTGKWDHPRVCGEKAAFSSSALLGAGSPPRVRGKASALSLLVAQRGITPACAGKSIFGIATRHALKDHPRVCGEKRWIRFNWTPRRGSPPRVRGKAPTADLDRQCVGRITPACAGKSLLACRVFPFHGDHPRVCGEKHGLSDTYTSYSGSPPRVRGKD